MLAELPKQSVPGTRWEGKSLNPIFRLSFSTIAFQQKSFVWSPLPNQCSLLHGPVPSPEAAFLCPRQCYVCRALVMAASLLTGIWLVCAVLLKPPCVHLVLGAGIRDFGENFWGLY